jgi:arylformamidase
VTVGGAELPEWVRPSESYYEAWRKRGLPGEFVPLPGRDHFTALEELATPEGILTKALGRLVFAA